MLARSLAVVLLACSAMSAIAMTPPPIVNNRPVIGVFALPNSWPQYKSEGRSYFAGSYVDWLESGGARVVPIPYTMPADEMIALVNSLNGVLWTGGGADFCEPSSTEVSGCILTEFAQAGQLILDTVLSANRNGDYVPLWATCMGFELLNVLVADDASVLQAGFNSENLTLPLDFTTTGTSARMMQAPKVVEILTTEAVTMNNHHSGVTPEAFNGNSNLTSMFQMVSTNKDRNGREFVSTIEAFDYPIYASQWHPEKVQYEWWALEAMNHSPSSVMANSHFALFFGSECRRNNRSFATEEALTNALIYNYAPVFTGPVINDFQQCYFFA